MESPGTTTEVMPEMMPNSSVALASFKSAVATTVATRRSVAAMFIVPCCLGSGEYRCCLSCCLTEHFEEWLLVTKVD